VEIAFYQRLRAAVVKQSVPMRAAQAVKRMPDTTVAVAVVLPVLVRVRREPMAIAAAIVRRLRQLRLTQAAVAVVRDHVLAQQARVVPVVAGIC